MEHKFWISIALAALTTFVVLGSGLSDSYDSLRYNAPELNAESLYSDQPHSRRKRAAVNIPEATETVVNDTTLFMYKTGEYENVTTMKVGSRMSFLLAAQFPLEETDFLVELFTPDNESTIMAIYDVDVLYVGSVLSYTNDPVQVIYESKEEDTAADVYLPDRVILDFGNVSHSGVTSGPVEDSMIQIRWSVVMIDSNATVNGSTVWVSAGAEYNNDEEIWIGQASFETIVEDFESMTPTFNYSGPDTVEIGSTASFTIEMVNPYPSMDISLDVFAPLNDTGEISVCSIAVSDVGSAYACKPCLDKVSKTRDKGKLTFFESDTGFGNFKVRLDLGKVTGTGFQDETPPTEEERTIKFEFTIAVKDDESIIGEDFWIGAATTLGDSQIWAGQLQITVANRTDRNLTIDTDPIITMTTVTDPYEVGLFYSVKYYLDIEFPENTISDYVLEVLAPFNETAQMRICRVQVLDYYNGVNAPCILSEPEYLKRLDDENAPDDRVVWPLGRLENNGARSKNDDATANRVRFEIVAQVLNHTMNVDGEKAWITAGLQYSNAETLWVGQNAIVFNESAITSLDTPDYNMVYTFGDENIPVGGVGSINLTITTKRGSVYEPMDMEIIMPFENDSAVVTLCRAEITHVGKNMPCTDWAKINSSITYTSKANDPDKPDKAIVNLGHICNVGDETQTEPTDDDKLVITFSFKVQEHVLNEEGKEWWLSVGNMFHDTRMWVGMLKMNITVGPPETYTDVSVNLGPFCPNVYYYKPVVLEEVKKVGGLVDKLVEEDNMEDHRGDKKDDNELLEQMVQHLLDENRSELLLNTKPKREEKNDENPTEKAPTHDLLSLLRQSLGHTPNNHDLLALLRQNLGNSPDVAGDQNRHDLLNLIRQNMANMPEKQRDEILKTATRDLLPILTQIVANMPEGERIENPDAGDHGLLALLRQRLGKKPDFQFLEDGQIPPDYDYEISRSSLPSPFLPFLTLSILFCFILSHIFFN